MAKKKSTDEITEELTAPDTETLEADRAAAATNVADLREALTVAEAELQEKDDAIAAAQPQPEPVVGPRIKLEHSGEIRSVAEGEQRERRLLLDGINYEHVSDAVDQDEVIWVYRQM